MMNEHVYAMDRARVEELRALTRFDPAALAEIKAKLEARAESPQRSESGGVIAVIPISGFIEQRQSFFGAIFGGTSTQRVSAQFRASMADPAVKAIVLDVSSGGGSVFGVTELANEIMAARGVKPTASVVDSTAARAAYNEGLTVAEGETLEANPDYIATDEAYVQFVMGRAAESYAAQYGR